jgi:hypothetical protein
VASSSAASFSTSSHFSFSISKIAATAEDYGGPLPRSLEEEHAALLASHQQTPLPWLLAYYFVLFICAFTALSLIFVAFAYIALAAYLIVIGLINFFS